MATDKGIFQQTNKNRTVKQIKVSHTNSSIVGKCLEKSVSRELNI